MKKRFKSYDRLALFSAAARHLNFTAAAEELHMSKGAMSYQIRQLESEIGFALFSRQARGVELTTKGVQLLGTSEAAFNLIGAELDRLQNRSRPFITIGTTTYFASRWLSQRLMRFTDAYPDIGLRLQPTVGIVDARQEGIDLLIRWGQGNWSDLIIEKLFDCPAFPTANSSIVKRIQKTGIQQTVNQVPLLHDADGSHKWEQWYDAAKLFYEPVRGDLVIEDPNVRVQAVIDGQGIALNDDLIKHELDSGILKRISTVSLADCGYYMAYADEALLDTALAAFRNWLTAESRQYLENRAN